MSCEFIWLDVTSIIQKNNGWPDFLAILSLCCPFSARAVI